MKHKTWFRLVLKAIGILLIGLGLPEVVARSAMFITHFLYQTNTLTFATPEWVAVVLHLLPPLLQAAFGLYLLLGGAWIVNMCVPSNRIYCPECGYDMSQSNDASKCSECGTAQPNRP